MNNIDLMTLVRPNICRLEPYSSARDEFKGKQGIFLDANENPFGEYNRYPDPHQTQLRKALAERKAIDEKNIFIGNGSDEAIDLILRILCEPRKDSIIICPPTYGMYQTSADINNVKVIEVPLNDDFQPNIDSILQQSAKCLFLCSPNNPTGNILEGTEELIKNFKGVVVVDEAYIDFSTSRSFVNRLNEFKNLIVLQTFSKAWGLASARVGVAYADADIIKLLDKVKPPYNVSTINQKVVLEALSHENLFQSRLSSILEQRTILSKELSKLPFVKCVYPSDANFLLVETSHPNEIYNYLASKNIAVRNRDTVVKGCLRITIGSPEENTTLINELKNYNPQL
jgi:histidinol-phosphate aminotransferase